VDAKVRKAQNLLWACRKACDGAWGLSPRVARWMHISVIRPTIIFASLVWWPSCQAARVKKKLSSIQQLACLGITGVHHPHRRHGGASLPPSIGVGGAR
jgi:hypothetical protein